MRRTAIALCLALVALAAPACARAPKQPPRPALTTEPTASVEASSSPATATSEFPAPLGLAAAPPADVSGEDAAPVNGQHDCYVVGVDAGPRTITVDYVQVFRDREAEQAAKQADEQLPPGVRHYIRDTNPTEHTFPLADGVEPPRPSTTEVYRITVENGVVTRISAEKLP